ncbi:MAG: sugar ABC transporter substrate-binding protein [Anaerolineae bacterium]|nr:sugar ABC transporter substrate-binding protein [Anaerolineae bacterium]
MASKKLSRRDFLRLSALAAAGAALAGCCPTAEPTTVEKEVVVTQVVEKEGEKVVVTVMAEAPGTEPEPEGPVDIFMSTWTNTPEEFETNMIIIDKFMEINPDINVNVIYSTWNEYPAKVQTLAAGGNAPDVMWVITMDVGDWAARNFLVNLEPYIDATDVNLDDYLGGGVDMCSFDGTVWTLPRDIASRMLWYNKDMFDAAGLPYPTMDTTLADLREQGLELSDPANNILMIWNYNWELRAFLKSSGGQFMNEGGTEFIMNQPVLDTLTWFQALQWEDHVMPQPGDLEGIGDPFNNQNCATALRGAWMFSYYMDNAEFPYAVTAMPKGLGGFRAIDVYGLPTGVSSASRHPDQAWKLVRFLTYDVIAQTMQADLGIAQPAIKAQEAWDAWFASPATPEGAQDFVDSYADGSPQLPFVPGTREAWSGVVEVAINSVLNNEGSAEELIPPAVEEANGILAQAAETIERLKER